MYGGKVPKRDEFLKFPEAMQREAGLLRTASKKKGSEVEVVPAQELLSHNGFNCSSDGSWVERCKGGMGFVLKKNNELIAYKAESVMAWSPLHSEAIALLKAVRYVGEKGIKECVFYTDSEILVRICVELGPPINVEWRVADEAYQLWEIMKRNEGFKCLKIDRCLTEEADHLAKTGRELALNYEGFTYPIFSRSG